MLVADSSTHVEPVIKSRLGIAEGLEHLLKVSHGLLDPALHSLHLGMLEDVRQPLVREPDRPPLMVYQNLHAVSARSTRGAVSGMTLSCRFLSGSQLRAGAREVVVVAAVEVDHCCRST